MLNCCLIAGCYRVQVTQLLLARWVLLVAFVLNIPSMNLTVVLKWETHHLKANTTHAHHWRGSVKPPHHSNSLWLRVSARAVTCYFPGLQCPVSILFVAPVLSDFCCFQDHLQLVTGSRFSWQQQWLGGCSSHSVPHCNGHMKPFPWRGAVWTGWWEGDTKNCFKGSWKV